MKFTFIQFIIFLTATGFAGLGILIYNQGDKVIPILLFTFSFILIVFGGLDPVSLSRFSWKGGAGGQEVSMERHQPTEQEKMKSSTTGKAGGLKESEPLEAVENLEPPKGDYC